MCRVRVLSPQRWGVGIPRLLLAMRERVTFKCLSGGREVVATRESEGVTVTFVVVL